MGTEKTQGETMTHEMAPDKSVASDEARSEGMASKRTILGSKVLTEASRYGQSKSYRFPDLSARG